MNETDGSVLIGGSGDEVSSHRLAVVPARNHPAGTTIQVGVTSEALIPGILIVIPQAGPQYSDLSRIVMERAKTANALFEAGRDDFAPECLTQHDDKVSAGRQGS